MYFNLKKKYTKKQGISFLNLKRDIISLTTNKKYCLICLKIKTKEL